MKNIEQNNQVHPISPKLGHFIFWTATLFICYVTIQNGFGASTIGEYAFFIGFFVVCFLWPVWIVAEMLQRRILYASEHVVASRLFLKPISMNLLDVSKIQFHSGRTNYRSIIFKLNNQKVTVSTTQKGFWDFARSIHQNDRLKDTISYGFLNSEQHFWMYENQEGLMSAIWFSDNNK